MTGVCGWLGASAPVADAQAVLTGMARALGCPAEPTSLVAEQGAVTAYSPFAAASMHRADGLLAAIDGRPHFDDDALTQMARSASPAAALALAYRRFGNDCLRHVHGSFALAVIDPASNTVLLAVDRMGIQRLCFAPVAGGMVFGGTCDSILAHPAIAAGISRQGLFNYLHAHMVPAPGTIYEGIEKLLPAQFVLLRDGQPTRGFY